MEFKNYVDIIEQIGLDKLIYSRDDSYNYDIGNLISLMR